MTLPSFHSQRKWSQLGRGDPGWCHRGVQQTRRGRSHLRGQKLDSSKSPDLVRSFLLLYTEQKHFFSFRATCMWSVPRFQQRWRLWTPFTDAGLQVCADVQTAGRRTIPGVYFHLLSSSGKMITAAYVPLPTYHNLFPDSVTAKQLLMPSRR